MIYSRLALAATSALVLAACESTPSTPPGPPQSIEAASSARLQVAAGALTPDSFKVRVTDGKGKGVPNVEVRWRSSSRALAVISPDINVTDSRGYAATAVQVGRSAGTAEVIASMVGTAGPVESRFEVVVVPGAPSSVRIPGANPLLLGLGSTVTLLPTVQDALGNVIPNPALSWTSSNPAVLEVSSGGVLTTKATGSATVTAAIGSVQATLNVQVSAIIFQDNFDTENGGRPAFGYTGLLNWQILVGNVDLIGVGGQYDYFPGNGLYVDLDGVYAGATIRTRGSFNLTPGTYTLRFRLAGSQRGDTNTATVTVGTLFSEAITLPSAAPLTVYTRPIVLTQPTTVQITFAQGGDDGFGLILDDVSLSRQ